MKNKRITLLSVILILSFGNYFRIQGVEEIRLVEFLSIFSMGAISALLVKEIANVVKQKE